MQKLPISAKPAPSSMGQLPLYRDLNLGRILQVVLPVLAEYRAFTPKAIGLYWPVRKTAYGVDFSLAVPGNKTSMYVTYLLKRGTGRDLVRRNGERYWDWNADGNRYLTIEVPETGDQNSCRGVLWLLQALELNVSRTPLAKLADYGYQDIGTLSGYESKTLNYCLHHVSPKWWPFCRVIWEQIPGALMPISCTPLVAAYRSSTLSTVRVPSSSQDFNKFFGPGSKLNDMVKVGARNLDFKDTPFDFNPQDFGAWNSNPALVLFKGYSSEPAFWERRKLIMLRGYEV